MDNKNNLAKPNYVGDKVIEIEGRSGDMKLSISGYSGLNNGINASAVMLLDCMMVVATMEGLRKTLVKLPLKDYMAMRGLSDIKSIREQVKRDLNALWRVSFEYRNKNKKQGTWLQARILADMGQIENGDIIFGFSHTFFDIFMIERNKPLFMYFPIDALKGNIRQHPYKFWLARRIALHKRLNLGENNENIIGVQTLISACPNFPTLEDVSRGNRNITSRIVAPFERDMNELASVFTWHYNGKNPKHYDEFVASSITIHWCNYPDVEKLTDKKTEYRSHRSATATPRKKGSGVQVRG